MFSSCTQCGRGGVHFLHSRMCFGCEVGNTLTFGLLLKSAGTVWRLFLPTVHPPLPVLGGDTAGTVAMNGPKGYSIPCNVIVSNKK